VHVGPTNPHLLHLSSVNHTVKVLHYCPTGLLHRDAWCGHQEPASLSLATSVMAQDNYREQSSYYDYSDPRMQYSSSYHPADPYKPKSRQSSRDRSDGRSTERPKYSQPHQPINEAVNSPDTAAMNSELIAQITEHVIKQLRTNPLEGGTPIHATHQQYPPPPPQQPVPQSPTTQSGSPPMPTRDVYTPPSPQKHSDHPAHGSPEQTSAVPHGSPPTPPDPSSSHFEDRRPPSRVSVSNEAGNSRPKGPTRLSTSKQETTLEKIWGQLFDEEGLPTARLGQFLRGLAVHIVCKLKGTTSGNAFISDMCPQIEDYEPLNSIVITPYKMQKYYSDVRLPNEAYPWSGKHDSESQFRVAQANSNSLVIFDDERSQIGRMYRELECQHHLVQEQFDEKPDIPSLTPVGFERWVTLLIRAHPTEEFERLKKALLEMPISNPDDKKERFPKDISRRLFPFVEDRKIRDRLQQAICEHANITLPKVSNPDPPKAPQAEATPRQAQEDTRTPLPPISIPSHIERERKPYSSTPNESVIDDTNPPAHPIERERKPYRVQPGGGKTHEEDGRTTIPNVSVRSNSTTERARPMPIGSQAPRTQGDLPVPEIHQLHGGASARRRHSPSFSAGQKDFRRSDGDLSRSSYQPSNYQPPSLSSSESYEEDARRYGRDTDIRRAEYARRQADEDASRYGGSPSTRGRYEPRTDAIDPRRGPNQTDEDYYRSGGRNSAGSYEYPPGYGGAVYR